MEQYICYIQLIGGLMLLVLGGNYLVDASSDVARRFKISSLIIGLTIVSFGTSSPELLVSASAALSGHSDIALGNVVGSNIVNIGFIGGLTALLLPFFVSPKSIKIDGVVMVVFSILLFLGCIDGVISRLEGLIIFSLLFIYVYWSIIDSKKNTKDEVYDLPKHNIFFNIVIIIVSLLALTFGSDLMVKGASEMALRFGINERVISLIVVAVGTSLPELAASIASILKKEVGITIGNIVGSNIFNIGAVLGISSIITPINISFYEFKSDLYWFIGFAILLIIGMLNITQNVQRAKETGKISELWSSKNGEVGRIWGAFSLLVYGVYTYLLW